VRKPTVKKGQTYSDSITADILAIEADTGMASYYAEKFHGKSTSSGEKYNMHDLTCAHRWLPYGTRLRVVNLANGREVIVRVNDRGPFHHSRMIDLSKAAAKELDMIRAGTARVEVRVASP
jgi:rare lipoprotein A